MADGFIVRKGGVAEEVLRTAVPSINFVSKTDSEIVVTFTNNDAAEAEIYYGITSTLTDTVTLAAAATSSNITFSGLTQNTTVTVSAYALVTDPTSKKIKSEIVTTVITTDAITFTAATGGTTLEYDSGGKRFKSHTFTTNGNFVVSTAGNGDRNQVDYLIIAGGGGGHRGVQQNYAGGAGGAGGFRTTVGTQGGAGTLDSKATVTATTFNVIIGAGGAVSTTEGSAFNGLNSSVNFSPTITSTGGGRGGNAGNSPVSPGTGGSGGGGATGQSGSSGTANQGFAGGNGVGTPTFAGGGGGGAGEAGVNGGRGGNGLANTLRNGTSETRAGGGGGGIEITTRLVGGSGGGGDGGANATNQVNGLNGTVNTGSGGGGGNAGFNGNGGAGGSGIVVIRYEIAPSV